MKTGAIWGISLGVGIPGVLILTGVIGLLLKFFMKRCRKKAWSDINSEPKAANPPGNGTNGRKAPKRTGSDRQPLYQSGVNTTMDTSDIHIAIPMDTEPSPAAQHEQTLVQIQRDRLNRLKEEENRLRPMLQLNRDELDIQRTIDQAQKEFDESV